MGSNLVKYWYGMIVMKGNVHHLVRHNRIGYPRLRGEQLLWLLGIVIISIGLLCSGLGCGRKGPLKPLKKEAPPYNFV
jgi:hypothetical protein